MGSYLVTRAMGALAVIFGVTLVVFVVLRLTGDPTSLMLDPSATRQDYERLRVELGVDQPVAVQYGRFIVGLTRGEIGRSFTYKQPAGAIVLEALPATAQLAVTALLITICVGIPLGVWSAVRRNSRVDYFVSSLTLIGQSMPNFWFGMMLIYIFAVHLGWLPTSGSAGFRHLVLPSVVLAAYPVSKFARMARSELLEQLGQDYVRTARAKGVHEQIVVYRHALRNALLSLVTLLGLDFGYLLGGAIITETLFGWPGMGRLVIQAISQRDFPVVQAAVFYMASVIVVINLLVDVLYTGLDPRVRLG